MSARRKALVQAVQRLRAALDVDDEAGWLAMLEDRNRTVHTYDEELAKAIYARISNYLPLLESLVHELTE